MGLNIGIEVLAQTEGYGEYGHNPKGSPEEIERRFFEFLNNKFPLGGFCGGWVHFDGKEYDFDVRMSHYSGDFISHGYRENDMYLAITEFIYQEFSHMEGIKLRTYWSG